ncbi:hypothetical protein D3C84_946050 [compost metagenome]
MVQRTRNLRERDADLPVAPHAWQERRYDLCQRALRSYVQQIFGISNRRWRRDRLLQLLARHAETSRVIAMERHLHVQRRVQQFGELRHHLQITGLHARNREQLRIIDQIHIILLQIINEALGIKRSFS